MVITENCLTISPPATRNWLEGVLFFIFIFLSHILILGGYQLKILIKRISYLIFIGILTHRSLIFDKL